MEFTITLSEQQINLWGQVLLEAKLTHAESLVRAELLQLISIQTREQRQVAQQPTMTEKPTAKPKTNGAHPNKPN